jgi:prefoldin subunit 5
VLNQLRLNQEADKARIQCLESEKHHLEILNKENVAFKEKYKQKCDTLETHISSLNEESLVFRKDIVAIDELKRDRDARLKILRDELESLTDKFESLQKDNAELSIRHKSLTSIHTKQTDDFE